jgi:tetratricopeptide (TPR) repeat protein
MQNPKSATTCSRCGSSLDSLDSGKGTTLRGSYVSERPARVAESSRDNASEYYQRGMESFRLRQFAKAIADFSRAIELDPKYVEAYANRGYAYSEQGKTEQAIKDYERVIALDPNRALAYYNRGVIFLEEKNLDRAIEDFSTAIRLSPGLVHAYFNRAVAYEKRGQRELAIADCEAMIKVATEPSDVRNAERFLRRLQHR